MNERTEHFTPSLQFRQWKLYALVRGERFTERLAHLGVLNRLIDTELSCAQAARCLPDSIFVEEVLNHL